MYAQRLLLRAPAHTNTEFDRLCNRELRLCPNPKRKRVADREVLAVHWQPPEGKGAVLGDGLGHPLNRRQGPRRIVQPGPEQQDGMSAEPISFVLEFNQRVYGIICIERSTSETDLKFEALPSLRGQFERNGSRGLSAPSIDDADAQPSPDRCRTRIDQPHPHRERDIGLCQLQKPRRPITAHRRGLYFHRKRAHGLLGEVVGRHGQETPLAGIDLRSLHVDLTLA